MIRLHHCDGTEFFLNADLVERLTNDDGTIVILFDGRRLPVAESGQTIVERIRAFRASVLREAEDLQNAPADLLMFRGSAGGR